MISIAYRTCDFHTYLLQKRGKIEKNLLIQNNLAFNSFRFRHISLQFGNAALSAAAPLFIKNAFIFLFDVLI